MNIYKTIKAFGTLSLINFGRIHAEKLAQSDNAGIAAGEAAIMAALTRLQNAYSARRPLIALQVQATQIKNDADEVLDDAISALSYDLLSPSNLKGNRTALEYRALFPDGTIRFINSPVRAELAHVRGMVAYLQAHPDHPMSDRASEIEQKAAALEASLLPQAQAEAAHKAALEIERDAKKELVRVLKKSVYLLRAELEGDERAVNRYFPTAKEAKTKEEPEPVL